ncbi:MAG TPA: glycosyltransferase family 9 protein [bacterium]
MDARGSGDAVSLKAIIGSSAPARAKWLKAADWAAARTLLPWVRARPAGRPPEPSAVRRILVIRPGGIGDAILLLPCLAWLRRWAPHAALHVAAERRNAAVFSIDPSASDLVLTLERSPWRLWRMVRRAGYDVVIDTEQWHALSGLLTARSAAPVRIGFDTNPARSRCYSAVVPYRHDAFEGESFLTLLGGLGAPIPHVDWTAPYLGPGAAAREEAERFAPAGSVAVAVRGGIPERDWGARKLEELLRRVGGETGPVLLLGGEEDRRRGASLARRLGTARVLDATGRLTLAGCAGALARSAAFVGTDSGLMHLASAVGTPVVALFGSGIQAKWAPRGPAHRILNRRLPCSPCTRFGCTPRCPYDVRCLKDIEVEDVADALRGVLAQRHPA